MPLLCGKLIAIAMLAGLLPARKASAIDSLMALRTLEQAPMTSRRTKVRGQPEQSGNFGTVSPQKRPLVFLIGIICGETPVFVRYTFGASLAADFLFPETKRALRNGTADGAILIVPATNSHRQRDFPLEIDIFGA